MAPPDQGLRVETPDGPRTYRNLCPHSGGPLARPGEVPLSRDRAHLVCAGHGALFRISDGLCIAGPCKGEHLALLDQI